MDNQLFIRPEPTPVHGAGPLSSLLAKVVLPKAMETAAGPAAKGSHRVRIPRAARHARLALAPFSRASAAVRMAPGEGFIGHVMKAAIQLNCQH